jgi:hypothetical protein
MTPNCMLFLWLFCAYTVGLEEFYRVRAPLFVSFPQDMSFGANEILWKKYQEIMVESRQSV